MRLGPLQAPALIAYARAAARGASNSPDRLSEIFVPRCDDLSSVGWDGPPLATSPSEWIRQNVERGIECFLYVEDIASDEGQVAFAGPRLAFVRIRGKPVWGTDYFEPALLASVHGMEGAANRC